MLLYLTAFDVPSFSQWLTKQVYRLITKLRLASSLTKNLKIRADYRKSSGLQL
jgi:hypothetical protein